MTMPPSLDETAPGPPLEILPGQLCGRLSFPDLFGRAAPVEIEVGIGKGRFLLQQAETRRDVDFLGLEWSLKHLRVAKERAERRGLRNLRLYRADARHVIADLVPDASIARLHVYCPDPWPKKRHRKRRFFVPETVPHLERALAPGGYLHVSTDVREYFEEILEVLASRTGLLAAADPLFTDEAARSGTHYEEKYREEGRAIHRASYQRPAGAARHVGGLPS
ncbi:MAG: tRNA (guanosine(46)-N7)-methyltransferase TrmB [Acidobacteria bacterium]|nr:MAG: tRNA (guanosine(46)-N7)-methyltransferase TrmB [Acidobacteriota bacterium]